MGLGSDSKVCYIENKNFENKYLEEGMMESLIVENKAFTNRQ